MYKIILDRMVGQHKLHPDVYIGAAGNLETDNAIVESMSTALQSRMVHLELSLNNISWVKWAINKGFDHRITDYVGFMPDHLFNFQPDHTDKTFSCPRTWEFANRLISDPGFDMNSSIALPLLAGTLGEGVAVSFREFCQIKTHTFEDILNDPTGLPIPEEPSHLFATCGCIAHQVDETNIAKAMGFIMRMPPEFMSICLRESCYRQPKIRKNPMVQNWAINNADDLF